MILPSYLIYFVFIFVPILITIAYSFTNYNLYNRFDFVGFDNYIRLAGDADFIVSAKNTVIYSVVTIGLQIALGLLFAVLLNQKIIGKKWFRTAFYLPYIPSMIAVSMVWLWIYDPASGLMNQLLRMFGMETQQWLLDPDLALFSIILMSIWKVIGYNMIIYLTGLQQIPGELYEAAIIDGASPVKSFFHITIPLLKPTTVFLLIINSVNSFSVFEQVYVMTEGGPLNSTTTIVHQVYERGFTQFQMGYASAMSVVLMLVVIALSIFTYKWNESKPNKSKG